MELNVDEILGKSSLKVIVNGKTYEVMDLSLEDFLNKPEDDMRDTSVLRKQVARAFGVEESELKDLGIRALLLILNNIRKWMVGDELELPKPSEVKKEGAIHP